MANARLGRHTRWSALVGTALVALAAAGVTMASHAGAATVSPAAAPAVAPAVAVISTPPMGWASWNSFAAQINYNVIKAQADALVSSGMAAAGYQYVNIDEGWWQGTRDSAGNITVDAGDWPGGMAAIASYIHGKGLKAGIYTDAGRDGCGYYYPTGRPAAPGSGSEGHYDQDFLQFSRWGFDYVKVDWCGGNAEGLNPQSTYQAISDAIGRATASTGRPMVLSVCDWGNGSPWNWAPGMSNLWRTSQDIIYFGQSPSMSRVLTNFDAAQHPAAQSAGHYNDPDMLIVGMPGFSADQNRTHLGLWAISGAPLLAGNRLDQMDATTRAILTNKDVIAVDQDPLGRQGTKVAEDSSGLQVYSKTLSGTDRRAVLLLNRTGSTATITARWSSLGLSVNTAAVRNLWTGTDLGTFATSYSTSVPAGQAVLLTVSASTGGPTPSPTPSATRSTSPSPTTSATTSPTVSPTTGPTGGTGGACRVSYVKNEWPGGLTANVTITNTGGTAINGWSLTFTFPGDTRVTNAWNATVTQSGAAVTATNASYNGGIAPGANASFGFQGTWTSSDANATGFALNGTACAAG